MIHVLVDCILLLYMGDIVKFVLDIRGALTAYISYAVIDRWMLYVSRNGVKKLTLRVSNDDTYTLPSSIFNCSTLTHLKLSNCVFKPPDPFLGFQNLVTLHLEGTTFVPATSFCVIKAPLLAELHLILCRGTQYLNIVSPGLEFLFFRDSHSYLMLDCFMNCKNIRLLKLEFNGVVYNPTNDKISTLDNAEATLKYLDTPSFLERPLHKLEHIAINFFKSSKPELLFVKLLLSRTPSLLKMCIVQFSNIDSDSALELMRFPRASPRAELFYS
ncbi:hypothetical protein MTR67_046585 [Solanum verrucosum]|uniref:F-box/LRR-repeat protein 15/At3g58940/PEG3-like LRR domain-containing protein n=1 Tax=Solanum verrucosum TaxID=315347 RepID=A0AAF0UUV3_SOLVR|nr:F-box/FBD/LRR-repeat protein At1g13570-like [Solanum verrucosum]WMV53200.1 hypothetical protein MTR67_046585 [Solanum verrucosum]